MMQNLQHQIDSLEIKSITLIHPVLENSCLPFRCTTPNSGLQEKTETGNWRILKWKKSRNPWMIFRQYCADSPSIKPLPMIFPPLDSVKRAISEKNIVMFKSSFNLLTNTCNNCHKAANHAFNVIRIPDIPPVTNQVFEKAANKDLKH